jgi:hypothetical protein
MVRRQVGRHGGELLRALFGARTKLGTALTLFVGALFIAPQFAAPFASGSWRSLESPDVLVAPLATPSPTPTPKRTAAPTPAPRPAAIPRATAAPTPPTAVVPETSGGRWVYASWYGPGFFGNRTACGQTYTEQSWGIAHKTLPCGTMTQITYKGQTISAPVIDRGPYIAGREVDLSNAVKNALGFSGVQLVYFAVLR